MSGEELIYRGSQLSQFITNLNPNPQIFDSEKVTFLVLHYFTKIGKYTLIDTKQLIIYLGPSVPYSTSYKLFFETKKIIFNF